MVVGPKAARHSMGGACAHDAHDTHPSRWRCAAGASMSPARARKSLPVIGWREFVDLPDFGVIGVKAKIDTGARTSSLHAFRLVVFSRDHRDWARFEIHPNQRNAAGAHEVEVEVLEFRKVRSSNGTVQRRPVIRTDLVWNEQRWPIDVTLTNRDEMGFRMLLGRAALRRRVLVDPSRSYLGGSK